MTTRRRAGGWWAWSLAATMMLAWASLAIAQSDDAESPPTESPAPPNESTTPVEGGAAAARQALLRRFLPLPDGVPREIKNPYYARPAWKLWAEDPSPVTIKKPDFEGTFEPPPADKRKYPTFPEGWTSGFPPMETAEKPTVAGMWDDAYMSLDNYHTRLRNPVGQFIEAGKMRHEGDPVTRLALGVSFTTQSYAQRGRYIVDDTLNNLNTEKFFLFANCVRATPAHISYRDNAPDKAEDLYDGLFGHSFQSVGQSGSEVYALQKMMMAGACLPRKTKDLLNRNGAYSIVLLTLFKAALPFTDAAGQPVPYENELRHRPAYSSHGTPQHPHFCSGNIPFHSYDDDLHIRAMVDMARGMTDPPPVTILRLESLAVTTPEGPLKDQRDIVRRIKGASLTNIRIWGNKGDAISANVSLRASYDLQDKDLTFTCQSVYPNQKNVTIRETTPGVFTVTVTYDPKLPKGRIPIICVARNGTALPGNPAFLNFYFADANEEDDYGSGNPAAGAAGKKQVPVNVNLRPKVDLGLLGDLVRCKPGETVAVNIKATDPEGYPVTTYRWPGQVGLLSGDTFTYTVPEDAATGVYPVNLDFSDGTGGYTGKRMLVIVRKGDDKLPEGWAVEPLGPTKQLGTVSLEGDQLTFANQPAEARPTGLAGCYAFREASGPSDIAIRLPADSKALVGLMIARTLDTDSRRVRIAREGDTIRGTIKTAENSWGHYSHPLDEKVTVRPDVLRLSWRDGRGGAFLTKDGKTWYQLIGTKLDLPDETHYVGVTYTGGKGSASCKWVSDPGQPLPILATVGRPPDGKTGRYGSPLKIEVIPPEKSSVVRYTVDGTQPTAESPAYDKPIELSAGGRHEVRVAVFDGGKPQATVVGIYEVSPPPEKKDDKKE